MAEDRYSAGWMPGLSEAFHEEGGIWEIVGRVVGWPVGESGRWSWMTWDEAAVHYGHQAAGDTTTDEQESDAAPHTTTETV